MSWWQWLIVVIVGGILTAVLEALLPEHLHFYILYPIKTMLGAAGTMISITGFVAFMSGDILNSRLQQWIWIGLSVLFVVMDYLVHS